MNTFPLALAALLLPFAAQGAVTVDEFATGRIYSSVNSDGVSVFTDIEPAELQGLTDRSSSTVQNILPRAKIITVNAAAGRHSNPYAASQESGGQPEQASEEIAPELRDGGPPPEDH